MTSIHYLEIDEAVLITVERPEDVVTKLVRVSGREAFRVDLINQSIKYRSLSFEQIVSSESRVTIFIIERGC